jgi:mycothiol synthase
VSEPAWCTELPEETVGEVLALVEAATATDGTPPVGEHVLRGLRWPGQHLLAHTDTATDTATGTGEDTGARLAGYAQLDSGGTAELAVHPDARRRGIGTGLARALLARVDGGPLRVWAHGEHPDALALAATLGFRRVRELWQLRRELDHPELPEARMPDGVALRTFVVGQDEPELLRVNNAAFDWHPEEGNMTMEQLKESEQQPWFDPAGFLLAVDEADGRLLGFHWTKVHADPERIGEVYVVGVDPAEQGRKLGAVLTLAGLRHLRDDRGLDAVMLYVESDNHAAVRVYQRLGFTRWHTDVLFARS